LEEIRKNSKILQLVEERIFFMGSLSHENVESDLFDDDHKKGLQFKFMRNINKDQELFLSKILKYTPIVPSVAIPC